MPELPDICAYVTALERRVSGQLLEQVSLRSPFFLRSVEPRLTELLPLRVLGLRRLGKRIAIQLDNDYWLVMHLMIAGRLQWDDRPVPARKPTRHQLAVLHFDTGDLTITEAGTKKRASLFVVRGDAALETHDPGGLEVLECSFPAFANRMRRENRTLKRALTDPHILGGIGNAYSDEILHAARLSPVMLTGRLDDDGMQRLFDAIRQTLSRWRDTLVAAAEANFPKKVTACRPGMAVHGRFGKPCPVCRTAVQRIRYANNEVNYCPTCQTGGKMLADRALSRLLKQDWPRTVDEPDQQTP